MAQLPEIWLTCPRCGSEDIGTSVFPIEGSKPRRYYLNCRKCGEYFDPDQPYHDLAGDDSQLYPPDEWKLTSINPVNYEGQPLVDQELQQYSLLSPQEQAYWKRKTRDMNQRVRLKGGEGQLAPWELTGLAHRFNNSCAYCEKPLSFGGTNPNGTFDHVVPLGMGGTHSPENLVPSCVDCNQLMNQWTQGYPLASVAKYSRHSLSILDWINDLGIGLPAWEAYERAGDDGLRSYATMEIGNDSNLMELFELVNWDDVGKLLNEAWGFKKKKSSDSWVPQSPEDYYYWKTYGRPPDQQEQMGGAAQQNLDDEWEFKNHQEQHAEYERLRNSVNDWNYNKVNDLLNAPGRGQGVDRPLRDQNIRWNYDTAPILTPANPVRNTRLVRIDPDTIGLKLHNTNIVKFRPNHTELNTDGWYSRTTLQRMNDYGGKHFNVLRRRPITRGVPNWWVSTPKTQELSGTDYPWNDQHAVPYFDGMQVDYEGNILNPGDDPGYVNFHYYSKTSGKWDSLTSPQLPERRSWWELTGQFSRERYYIEVITINSGIIAAVVWNRGQVKGMRFSERQWAEMLNSGRLHELPQAPIIQTLSAAPQWGLPEGWTEDDSWDEDAPQPNDLANPTGMPRPIYENVPVPWTADILMPFRGDPAEPAFKQVDPGRMESVYSENLCVLCGLPLTDPVYAFLLSNGRPVDGPLHQKCAAMTRAHCPHIRDDFNAGKLPLAEMPLSEWNKVKRKFRQVGVFGPGDFNSLWRRIAGLKDWAQGWWTDLYGQGQKKIPGVSCPSCGDQNIYLHEKFDAPPWQQCHSCGLDMPDANYEELIHHWNQDEYYDPQDAKPSDLTLPENWSHVASGQEWRPNGADLLFQPGDRVQLPGGLLGTVMEKYEDEQNEDGTITQWMRVKKDDGRVVQAPDGALRFVEGLEGGVMPETLPENWSHVSSDLSRFVDAQDSGDTYQNALTELQNGKKNTHWMWFVFPQLAGLGTSQMSQHYALSSLEEAREYLADPTLGGRVLESCRALLGLDPSLSAEQILGPIDAKKLQSSLTLFALADPSNEIFKQLLDRFYGGSYDPMTEQLLAQNTSSWKLAWQGTLSLLMDDDGVIHSDRAQDHTRLVESYGYGVAKGQVTRQRMWVQIYEPLEDPTGVVHAFALQAEDQGYSFDPDVSLTIYNPEPDEFHKRFERSIVRVSSCKTSTTEAIPPERLRLLTDDHTAAIISDMEKSGAEMPPNFADALRQVVQMRDERVIRDFCLVGGVAAMLYAEPRYTKDLDIVVLVGSDDEWLQILQHARTLGPEMGWAGVELSGVHVEFLPSVGFPLYEAAFESARTQEIEEFQAKVASPEMLIVLALQAWRPIDRTRIEELLPISDQAEIESVISRFDNSLPPLPPGMLTQRFQTFLRQRDENASLSVGDTDERTSRFYDSKREYHKQKRQMSFTDKLAELSLLHQGGIDEKLIQLLQPKPPEPRPEQEFRAPTLPDWQLQEALYYHRCPVCGSYLRDRGGVFTCTSCPFEWTEAEQ